MDDDIQQLLDLGLEMMFLSRTHAGWINEKLGGPSSGGIMSAHRLHRSCRGHARAPAQADGGKWGQEDPDVRVPIFLAETLPNSPGDTLGKPKFGVMAR
jgi:hypothetical protein